MPVQKRTPVRCAILPPVPVPYREPLFAELAERGIVSARVVYQSGTQLHWNMDDDWFPERHGYESEVLGSLERGRPGRTPVVFPRGLGPALARADPACVVSWEYGPATLLALAWCARRGRPLVIFSELTPHSAAVLGPLRRRLHRLVAARASGFIVASSAGVGRLEELGVDPGRVEVSLQSIDAEPIRRAAASGGHDGRPVRVTAVGRLVADKNLNLLIEAFAEAAFEPGEAELELCGSGPLEAELRAAATRLGVPVRFRGYVPPGALAEVYARTDILALVSTWEPFGATMREGAAAGLPLLCTSVAGAAGDIAAEGENALLIDPRSRTSIARALGLLVRDRALRERLAQGSLRVTERHPLEADAEAFERAVLEAVGGRG